MLEGTGEKVDKASAAVSVNQVFISDLLVLVRRAGDAIMAIYTRAGAIAIEHKADDSPLTLADIAAHRIIVEGLPGILDIPLISEESLPPGFAIRQTWERYWLIDPLDGTKEFIARSGEFTVNIALIEHGVPVLGVVHLPTEKVTYLGVNNKFSAEFGGAWKYRADLSAEKICVRALVKHEHASLVVLASHRHGTEAVGNLLSGIEQQWPGEIKVTNAGSSLKFCLIAEGKADFYPRLSPTSEWDTAAAHAVLSAAGGAVVNASLTGPIEEASLVYNQGESLINPDFYALGDIDFDWPSLLNQSR